MKLCTICNKQPQMDTVVRCESCQGLFNQLRTLDPAPRAGTTERRLAPTAAQLRAVIAGGSPAATPRTTLNKAKHPVTKGKKKTLHPKRAEAYRLLREADADESKDSSGYLYAISDGSAVKLGKSAAHPSTRLAALQTGNPRRLKLIGLKKVNNRHTAEAAMHAKYIKNNILGEWFELNSWMAMDFDAP